MADPVVVYIGGAARSGTSALGLLLGAAPGVVWAGELRHLARDLVEDRQCTCGARASACPVWSEVGKRLGGPAGWRRARRRSALDRLAWGTDGSTVRAVAAVTGARIVIDSSKHGARPWGLVRDGLQVVLVQVVRSPERLADRHARRRGAVSEQRAASPVGWMVRDLETGLRWRSLRASHPVVQVDWDALVADRALLVDVCAAADIPAEPVLAAAEAGVRAEHVLTANRLRTGFLVLRPDPPPALPTRWRIAAGGAHFGRWVARGWR
ncbi:MAG: hypothetical protein ACI8PZ_003686 [Myxococcota bacterium]|jgi:hypothetical protein